MTSRNNKDKPGPEPNRVKIDKPWEKAISDALKKKRPSEGWPKEPKKNEKPADASTPAGSERLTGEPEDRLCIGSYLP